MSEGSGSVASSRDEIGVCPKCGTRLPASRPPDRCPVCQLRAVLDTEEAPSLTATKDGQELAENRQAQAGGGRFDHYELLTDGDGKPIELGHGAMGGTYRAFDTNLRCSVALKVINARFLNDEGARLRFVREARAAAQLRHPNVASVFHLGTKNGDYFYAMEFVEGETLEQLIRRQGPLPAAS